MKNAIDELNETYKKAMDLIIDNDVAMYLNGLNVAAKNGFNNIVTEDNISPVAIKKMEKLGLIVKRNDSTTEISFPIRN